MAQATRRTARRSPGKAALPLPKAWDKLLPCLGFLLASLLLMTLWSFDPGDIGWSHVASVPRQSHNWLGSQGAAVADVLLSLFGLGAYGVPMALVSLSIQHLAGVRGAMMRRLGGWMVLLPAWSALLWWLHEGPVVHSGGLLGEALGNMMIVLFGVVGGLALALATMVGLLWSAGISIGASLSTLGSLGWQGIGHLVRLRSHAPEAAVSTAGLTDGSSLPYTVPQQSDHLARQAGTNALPCAWPGQRTPDDAAQDHAAEEHLGPSSQRKSGQQEVPIPRDEPGHLDSYPDDSCCLPAEVGRSPETVQPFSPGGQGGQGDVSLTRKYPQLAMSDAFVSGIDTHSRLRDEQEQALSGQWPDEPCPTAQGAIVDSKAAHFSGYGAASNDERDQWAVSSPAEKQPHPSSKAFVHDEEPPQEHRELIQVATLPDQDDLRADPVSGPDDAPGSAVRAESSLQEEWHTQEDGCPWDEQVLPAHEGWQQETIGREGYLEPGQDLLVPGETQPAAPVEQSGKKGLASEEEGDWPETWTRAHQFPWASEEERDDEGVTPPPSMVPLPPEQGQPDSWAAQSEGSCGQMVRCDHLPIVCQLPPGQPAEGWVGPSVQLLNEQSRVDQFCDPEVLQDMAAQVEQRFCDFGIDVQVTEVLPGPVITRFELMPARGVKVSQIANLGKDLARALSVTSVRVVEVVPGKSVVGLEIPSEQRQLICLRDLLQTEAFMEASSPMTVVLGKDISGDAVVADLARMPHLLVAGTTGSGKSVAINAMILSLLYKSSPEAVRLILIDPKILELSVYEGIPHLLAPVVTDMRDAAKALSWCVGEMERRYRLMYHMGVRNLGGFNQKIHEAEVRGQPTLDPFDEDGGYLEALPAIVVVVDEFADLMMVVGKKIEQLIARLAQKARAAGIHLILATQRPSVDVITGLIKANIPTRIAFQVSSKIDSRTILDQNGAESLLGAGDMLYLPPGTGLPIRVHGAFVSDDEVHRVVADLRERHGSRYVVSAFDSPVAGGATGDGLDEGEGADPFYDEAVALVTRSRRASISSVQRQFRIGYNRAARLVEEMERQGVVGPAESNGNREVLAPPPPEGP